MRVYHCSHHIPVNGQMKDSLFTPNYMKERNVKDHHEPLPHHLKLVAERNQRIRISKACDAAKDGNEGSSGDCTINH